MTIDDIAEELGEVTEEQNEEKKIIDNDYDPDDYKRDIDEYEGGW